MVEIVVIRGKLVALVVRGRLYFSPTLTSQHRAVCQLKTTFAKIQYMTDKWQDGYTVTWEYVG